jgi:hypothetical protein
MILPTTARRHSAAFLATALAVASAQAPAKPTACRIDQVIYRQAGNTGTEAGFAKQRLRSSYASDLVFWVRGGGQTFWFGIEAPNGYGGTQLYQRIAPSAVKPAADGETPVDTLPDVPGEEDTAEAIYFDAFDAAVKAYSATPQSTSPAPAYIFARGLGPLFHYAHNGNRYIKFPAGRSVRIDIAMWRPSGCNAKAHRG